MSKKTKQQTELIESPDRQMDEELQKYLDSINWFDPDRPGLQSSAEIGKMLRDGLEKYVAGKVTQEYVIELANQLDAEFFGLDYDDYGAVVNGITCELSEINASYTSSNVHKNPEEIDAIIRLALEQLKQSSNPTQ